VDTANVLVIENDEIVARTIERSLRGDEFHVKVAYSGLEGLKLARQDPPDLVILDIIMPGMDGYEVCTEMRDDDQLAEVPILFLTAKIKDEDIIAGLKAGADDYITKPFNVDELVLRIRAILRRTFDARALMASLTSESDGTGLSEPAETQANLLLVIGDYKLDPRTFEVDTPNHGRIRLTPIQFDLLYHLMGHAGEVFSPMRLLDEIWDYPSDRGSPDLVRVHIKTLRERIENDPRLPTFIRTVPGFGYTIHPDPDVQDE
jgi:two-component system response regulator RpaA